MMTRNEHLAFCKKCINREFTISEGILCNLTGKKADFEDTCPDFEFDKDTVVEGMPVTEIRPNEKRAALATTMIWAVLIIDLFVIVSNYFQYQLIQDLQNGVDVAIPDLDSNDMRVALISLLYSAAYIISGVTFIQWFRRAYNNLAARTAIDNGEGWAAGAWFVPIISLFRPYKIMKELFTKTDKLIADRTGATIPSNEMTVVGIWWTLWIVVGYIANYSFKTIFKEDTLENLSNGTIADIISSGLEIPIGLLAIWIVTAFVKKDSELLRLERKAVESVESL